jgi:solute carrier family 25 protein 44
MQRAKRSQTNHHHHHHPPLRAHGRRQHSQTATPNTDLATTTTTQWTARSAWTGKRPRESPSSPPPPHRRRRARALTTTTTQPHQQQNNSVDGRKLLFVGLGMFTGVTGALYPLTVVKTRQMAAPPSAAIGPGLAGARQTARDVLSRDGVRGFYRGFGTVVFGTIPGRSVYLYALEATKAAVQRAAEGGAAGGGASDGGGSPSSAFSAAVHSLARGWTPAQVSAAANFAGGAVGSLAAQAVAVPVDVVSQRLMVAEGRGRGARRAAAAGGASAQADSGATRHGLAMARHIVRTEGVGGLYRGFWASVATFVPNSAVWWGAYGFYRKALAGALERRGGGGGGGGGGDKAASSAPSASVVVAVQTASSVAAGLTSGLLSTPLDVVKTRLQLATAEAATATAGPCSAAPPPAARLTWLGVARELVAQDGPRGLLRGAAPRMLSSALWGTAMVSTWETLKRLCVIEEEEEEGGEERGGGERRQRKGAAAAAGGSSGSSGLMRRNGAPAAAL